MSENKIKNNIISENLKQNGNAKLFRFITCGSVDDGKSTLIGRLLFETNSVYRDQLEALENETKYKRTLNNIDFSLLLDGLQAEREQGITIDVAYRYFSTENRKFIIADTPGHEQYTRNTATAASNAELAVILIDARNGILTQTKRHTFITTLLGIKNFIIAINKMDLVDYNKNVFEKIKTDFLKFYKKLKLREDFPFNSSEADDNIIFIPISALYGDNIKKKSLNMDWYNGKTLLNYLDTIKFHNYNHEKFRFYVQYINRLHPDFRGYAGQIASGEIKEGDEIVILPDNNKTKVKQLIFPEYSEKNISNFLSKVKETSANHDISARRGMSVTLLTEDEVDISRGDLMVKPSELPCLHDVFDIFIIWFDKNPLLIGKNYNIKIATTNLSGYIDEILYKINIDTLCKEKADQLQINEIAYVRLVLTKDIGFDNYWTNKVTGGLIFIDKITNNTSGVGLINRKATTKYIYWAKHKISKEDRSRIKAHKPCVIWFTGLSGAGKSTIANALEEILNKKGFHTYILDGDNIRHGLNRDLDFSVTDRKENIRRIAEISKLFVDAGIIVITAFISPFKEERVFARNLVNINEFIEVFIDTPIDICEKRDPKGLYKKAKAGKIKDFTGITSPYEAPESPEIHIKTDELTIRESVEKILGYLQKLKII